MTRPLMEIIEQIRYVNANPKISTTLIQTGDLETLCAAAEQSFNTDPEAYTDEQVDQIVQSASNEIKSLNKECSGLAANQCHCGYGDDYGNHRCKYQDDIERLRAGVQKYVDDNFRLKYSREDADEYFKSLLNSKDQQG